MHRTMLTRAPIDEAALRQNRMGRAPFVVPVSGHEGCQIGTAWAMRPGIDVWVPYYRDLGVVLRAGLTPLRGLPRRLLQGGRPLVAAGARCRRTGARALQIVSHSSPIATQVPHAAGIAYAARYRGEDVVVGCWFGEGATSEGDWHEGLNFAAHPPPARRVRLREQRVRDQRAPGQADGGERRRGPRAGYGIPGVVVDGSDVLACYAAMQQAHDRARGGEGPTLLECKTYRYLPHTSDDDDKTYRSREEVEEAPPPRSRRPVRHLLRSNGDSWTTMTARGAPRAEVRPRSRTPSQAAWDAPDPDPDDGHAPRVRRGRGGATRDREEPRHRDPRHAARRDGRATTGSSCSARTSGAGAASSSLRGLHRRVRRATA